MLFLSVAPAVGGALLAVNIRSLGHDDHPHGISAGDICEFGLAKEAQDSLLPAVDSLPAAVLVAQRVGPLDRLGSQLHLVVARLRKQLCLLLLPECMHLQRPDEEHEVVSEAAAGAPDCPCPAHEVAGEEERQEFCQEREAQGLHGGPLAKHPYCPTS